jgi:hypothetical protein
MIADYNVFFVHFQVENVRMIDRYNNKNFSVGTLYMTATHLIFVDTTNKETWVSRQKNKNTYLFCILWRQYMCP